MSKSYHPYHFVGSSPWPCGAACGMLLITLGAVMYMHYARFVLLLFGLVGLIISLGGWLRDVTREATYQGEHTQRVVSSLKMGFVLFLISEVLFFFSFFWAFFHTSLAPSIEVGFIWPPTGLNPLNPVALPLINTAFLLTSGATVTWAHYFVTEGKKWRALITLGITVALGLVFTSLQAFEYVQAPFCASDSVYGAVFFVTTGFHGLHVLIGTLFLGVCVFRLFYSHFTNTHHFGFEAASWYWHFVDVVWLFLYVCIYWWGS